MNADVLLRPTGAPPRSAKEVVIDAGQLPQGATDADFAAWAQAPANAAALLAAAATALANAKAAAAAQATSDAEAATVTADATVAAGAEILGTAVGIRQRLDYLEGSYLIGDGFVVAEGNLLGRITVSVKRASQQDVDAGLTDGAVSGGLLRNNLLALIGGAPLNYSTLGELAAGKVDRLSIQSSSADVVTVDAAGWVSTRDGERTSDAHGEVRAIPSLGSEAVAVDRGGRRDGPRTPDPVLSLDVETVTRDRAGWRDAPRLPKPVLSLDSGTVSLDRKGYRETVRLPSPVLSLDSEVVTLDRRGLRDAPRAPPPAVSLGDGMYLRDRAGRTGAAFTSDRIVHPQFDDVRRSRGGGHVRNGSPLSVLPTLDRIGQLLSGTGGRVLWMNVGDSLTAGQGAGTGLNGLVGARALSTPAHMVRRFARRGIPVSGESWWGEANVTGEGVSYPAYDPRVSADSWTDFGIATVGGGMMVPTDPTPRTFNPALLFSAAQVWYARNYGFGAFTIEAPSGAVLATVSCDGAPAMLSVTVAAPVGSTALILRPTAGAAHPAIIAVRVWDSAAPALDIASAGACGWTAGQWADASTAWAPRPGLAAVAPDHMHIHLGTNDVRLAVAPANTTDAIAALITDQRARGGGVSVTIPVTSNDYGYGVLPAAWQQRQTYDAIRDMCDDLNVWTLDLPVVFGGYFDSQRLGLIFDDLHKASRYYAIEGGLLAGAFCSMLF